MTGGTFVNRSTEDYIYGGGAPLTLNNSNDQPGTIIVTGGTFQGRSPAEGDDHMGGTFVAEGYAVVRGTQANGDVWYTVVEAVTDIDSLETAIANAKDGDTIAVTQDIKTDKTLVSLTTDKQVTVDLGGRTMTFIGTYESSQQGNGKAVEVSNGAALVLQNGKIDMIDRPYHGILAKGNAKLTMKNIQLSSVDSGIFSQGAGNEILVEDCMLNVPNYYAVYQNGSAAASTITLRDSTITSAYDAGVYISNADRPGGLKQSLVMENCTVTAKTAVEVKHTNAVLRDCTLIGTGPLTALVNGSGNCTTGYAFAMTTNDATEKATGNATLTNCKLYREAEGAGEGVCFICEPAEGYTVSINGKRIEDNFNTYD